MMAGKVDAPCLVRELDDAQALEAALVENGQRADVTPLDEATAFERLRELGRTSEQIAAKIGRSLAYVEQRLRLLALAPEVLDLMERGRLLMGGALLLAQLPRERQEEIASRLTHGTGVLSRRDVNTWVARTSRKVGLAVWPLEGTAHGPSCSACPKRSGTQRSLLAELEGDDLCLDAVCWAAKGSAWLDEQRAAGRVIASPEEVERITRWDAPWVLFGDEAVSEGEEGERSGTWGEVLIGVLPESATVIVVDPTDGEIRIAARASDVADAIEDDWPEEAARLRTKGERAASLARSMVPSGSTPKADESDEDRAAREARNAAADLERLVEEETRLLTIERIAEKTDDSTDARVMRGLVLGCVEAIGAWMLPEIAERRGVEGADDKARTAAMRKEIARYDADQCASVLAEMLAIRFVRNAPAGEVHAAIAPLLSAIRVEPAKVHEEVAHRYAPKPAVPEKKKATKVRSKRAEEVAGE